jgi:hypothetical protein
VADLKKVRQGHVSVYVNNVDLISLRQKYDYKERERKNDRSRQTQTSTACAQSCWSVVEFQTTERYSNLDPTHVKYSIYKEFKEKNLKITERIRPNSFVHSENMKSTWL